MDLLYSSSDLGWWTSAVRWCSLRRCRRPTYRWPSRWPMGWRSPSRLPPATGSASDIRFRSVSRLSHALTHSDTHETHTSCSSKTRDHSQKSLKNLNFKPFVTQDFDFDFLLFLLDIFNLIRFQSFSLNWICSQTCSLSSFEWRYLFGRWQERWPVWRAFASEWPCAWPITFPKKRNLHSRSGQEARLNKAKHGMTWNEAHWKCFSFFFPGQAGLCRDLLGFS